MKKFIVSILSVAVFFVGLGTLAEKVGAKFRSDEKALEIVRKARVAIGGDAAIADIRGMVVKGRSTFQVQDSAVERTENADTEIALQLPDKMMKTIKIGDVTAGGGTTINKQIDLVVVGDVQPAMTVDLDSDGPGKVKTIRLKKSDGTVQEVTGAEADKFLTTEDGANEEGVHRVIIKRDGGMTETEPGTEAERTLIRKKGSEAVSFTLDNGQHVVLDRVRGTATPGNARQNELLRTTLSLLLTAPQGIDIEYTYGGESSVDGNSCDIVNAALGATSYKLFISRSSNLPVAMSYAGHRMPKMMTFRKAETIGSPVEKDVQVFAKALTVVADTAEFMVKFSDYRTTAGVQLPYKWTTMIGDKTEDSFDVTSYDINPSDLGERFNDQKVIVRVKKS